MKIHWVPRNETRFETTIHRNPIWSSRIYIVNISLNFWRVFFASKKEFNILSVYWFSPAATAFGTDLYRVCACHIFHLNFKFFVGVVVLHEVFVDASTSLKIYKWIGAHTYFSERCKLICKHCNDANHTLIRDEGNNEGTKERKNCWKMNKTNCFVCTRFWMRAPRLSCARSNENSSMRIVQIVGTGALCTPKLRAYLSLFGVAFCSSFGRRDVETTTTTIKKNYVETFILKFVNKWNQNEEKNSFEFRACHSHSARAEHVVFILSHFISCFARLLELSTCFQYMRSPLYFSFPYCQHFSVRVASVSNHFGKYCAGYSIVIVSLLCSVISEWASYVVSLRMLHYTFWLTKEWGKRLKNKPKPCNDGDDEDWWKKIVLVYFAFVTHIFFSSLRSKICSYFPWILNNNNFNAGSRPPNFFSLFLLLILLIFDARTDIRLFLFRER